MSAVPGPRDDSTSSESLMGHQDRPLGEESAKTNRVSSDTLRRAPLFVIVTLLYAAIALFAWTVLCVLKYRPIGAQSYKPNLRSEDGFQDYQDYVSSKKNAFGQSDYYLRAARVCQSLASLLTIPLTSMVCSCAAVAFLRKRTQQSWQGPTLRQSMALADKGWNDPVLIAKLVSGGWKRYGSTFLVFALALNLLGASIAPFQGLFISYKSTKVPCELKYMNMIELAKWINFAADPIHNNDAASPMIETIHLWNHAQPHRSLLGSTASRLPNRVIPTVCSSDQLDHQL